MDQLFQAVMKGDAETVTRLVGQDPELVNAHTPSGIPAVLFSLYYGQTGLVRLLLERGAVVDVFSAAAIGVMGRLSDLLQRDPALTNAQSPDGFSPLGLAAFFGRLDAVQLLLQRGAQVNQPSNNPQKVTPLHSAVAGQHLEIARALLDAGAEVNAVQEGGFTPLMSAAQNGQVELVRFLLERGADRSKTTEDGRSAYFFADENPNPEVAALFVMK
jgi:ankyrin repeat protein